MAERRVTEAATSAARSKKARPPAPAAALPASPRSRQRQETGVETARIRRQLLWREVALLVAVATAALVALSLLSFHPGDRGPTWAETPRETRNWVGPVGAFVGGALVDAFGLCAFALPPLLGLAALLLFLARNRGLRRGEVFGFFGTAVALCVVADLAWAVVPFRGGELRGGGLLGAGLAEGLRGLVSTVGAWILALTALAISARLAFGVRVVAVVRALGRGASAVSVPVGRAAGWAGSGVLGSLRGAWARLGDLRASEPVEDEDVDDGELDDDASEPQHAPIPAGASALLRPPGPRVASSAPAQAQLPTANAVRPAAVVQSPREPSAMIARVEIVEDAATALIPEGPAPSAPRLQRPSVVEPARTATQPAQTGVESLSTSLEGAAGRGVVHAELRVHDHTPTGARTPPRAPTTSDRAATSAPSTSKKGSAPQLAPVVEAQPGSGLVSIPEPELDDDDAPAVRMAPVHKEPQSIPFPTGHRPQLSPRIQAPVGRTEPAPNDPPSRRWVPSAPRTFNLPSLALLVDPPAGTRVIDEAELMRLSARLEESLKHHQVEGRVTHILPGPVVTMFEFEPAPGIKVAKIASLENDLALALRALRVRIVAPIPGKGAVGIEIPSGSRETVYLREILGAGSFRGSSQRLPLALGKAIDGTAVVADMAKMPHLLVAGTTGSGKSVCVNSIILSLLYARRPEDVRMILVDPKMLEFSIYDGIPHLLVPVVTSPKKAAMALRWAVDEMERRYKVLSSLNVRNIVNYNERAEKIQAEWELWDASCRAGRPIDKPDVGRAPGEDVVVYRSEGGDPVGPLDKMPYIVIVIDELADLMMVARKEVEESIVRLAQKARASGIHLLLATQRPSVDVITGLIKANFPTRLSFQVRSKVDSRTVLDANGAENLLGMGDGLYLPAGASDPVRVHGAFVNDDEVKRVVDHLKAQGEPEYVDQVLAATEGEEEGEESAEEDGEADSMYDQAVAVVVEAGKASTSLLQRHLKLGYNRAARIIDTMEKRGIVGPADGARPREVYFKPYEG